MSDPNILLIVFDTARADSTELHGGPPTPALAHLASRGTSVRHAIAPACWTLPSHLSMFTGLLPRAAGVFTGAEADAGWAPIVRRHAHRSLPAVLSSQGWETVGISANAWISDAIGFDTGFDEFRLTSLERQSHLDGGSWKAQVSWILEALRARADDGAAEIERRINTWIHDRSRNPFFWFVNLTECHSPYLPPLPWNDLGPLDRVRAALDARQWQSFEGITRTCLAGRLPPEAALERMHQLYLRSVALMDAWLARVLETLDSAGLLDDTIVIVTSDHGENFGEQGLIGHAFSLDHRLIHVPLAMAGPEIDDSLVGDDGAFSLADLPGTIAHLVGLSEHPYTPPAGSGVAIAQLDAPSRDESKVDQVLDQLGFGADARARSLLLAREVCATDGRLKLRRSGEGETLVDLAADPLEERPRHVGRDEESRFHTELAALRRGLDQAMATEADAGADDHLQAPGTEIDPDLEDRLRMLGYL